MTDYLDKCPNDCVTCEFKSTLFKLLNDEELDLVHQNRLTVVFKPGETIRKQGTFMSHVISVTSGLAKLYLEGIEHRNAILRLVKPTNFIGGPGVYLDQMHHYTVTALLETSVCFIDINIFKEIMIRNRQFAEEFMKDFSRNTIAIYNRLLFLTQKQMPGRMADALLYLYDDIFQVPKFPMLVSKQDLADLSAMSRDSAGKILRDFQNEGMIRITDHEMEILNADGLRRISKIG